MFLLPYFACGAVFLFCRRPTYFENLVWGLAGSLLSTLQLSWCSRFVYFLSSLRGQTAKTLICTKSGVSADSRKSAEKCAKSAVLRTFRHFSALFLESAETPLFVQINVFAVWPLRLDRKYTILGLSFAPPSRWILQGHYTSKFPLGVCQDNNFLTLVNFTQASQLSSVWSALNCLFSSWRESEGVTWRQHPNQRALLTENNSEITEV